MINPKSFMEFFEKECGVQFIDTESGKKALDIIAEKEEKKNCLNCNYGHHGDGVNLHKDDTICVKAGSEHVADWVSDSNICDLWEGEIQ